MTHHASRSDVQQRAEATIRDLFAQRLHMELESRRVEIAPGSFVQVDATTDDELVLAEIFARQGKLKPGQQKKVAIDSLKLITLAQRRPNTELYLVFADEEAASYATGDRWLAKALLHWGVQVAVVEIPEELRRAISSAQATQTMVNAADVAEDIL